MEDEACSEPKRRPNDVAKGTGVHCGFASPYCAVSEHGLLPASFEPFVALSSLSDDDMHIVLKSLYAAK
jgi:hypothetical protein